jgi:hypothetical protein
MFLTKELLPLSLITPSTIPARGDKPELKGFKVAGAWLNGSHKFTSAEDLQNYLMGKEITHSGNNKSLVIVGDFKPVDTVALKTLLTKRETLVLEAIDLSSLL